MRLSSGKINVLLGLPSNPNPGEFYQIEGDSETLLYFCDTKGNLVLLNDSAGGIIGNLVIGEIPTGTPDGTESIFTLAHTPVAGSLEVYLNGLRLSVGDDYTLSTNILNMINIPYGDDIFLVDYRY